MQSEGAHWCQSILSSSRDALSSYRWFDWSTMSALEKAFHSPCRAGVLVVTPGQSVVCPVRVGFLAVPRMAGRAKLVLRRLGGEGRVSYGSRGGGNELEQDGARKG